MRTSFFRTRPSYLPYRDRFSAQMTEKRIYNWACPERGSSVKKSSLRAIFVSPGKMVLQSVRRLFHQPTDKKIKTWTLRFPAKGNPKYRRRHCLIGQSCRSMTSKRSIDWFLESSAGMKFISPERSLNQPKATPVCICLANQSNRSNFRSYVATVLFARFHIKVIRKLL